MFRIPRNQFRGLGQFRRLGLMLALALAATMLVAACDDSNGNGGGDSAGPIEIAYIPGWPDAVSTSNLWKVLLEEQGYEVVLTAIDVAPTFAGLSGGDVDAYTSAWLPNTHGQYTEEFGDDLNVHSVWYEPAGLYLTVPSYVEIDSLAELAENADMFDNQIVGIEAGAGMMGILVDDVMPAYGIEDWELIEGSTPAMLAELDTAIANEEPVVVTLWSPGWWYGAMDLKNLEDPENAWGDPDELTVVTRTGFVDDYPDVARWWDNWSMTDAQYSPLEELVTEMGDGNEEAAVQQWLEDADNRALVDGWID